MAFIDVRVRDRYGLHPRAALRIQQAIAGLHARVSVQGREGTGSTADAASLISLVSAGIGFNEAVRVTATGDDAERALAALKDLFDAGICHP